jgi:hypothetical protein
VDVHQHNLTFRGGYAASSPLRGWVAFDAGELTGAGVSLDNPQTGSGPWFAAGAGFGVAWPIVRNVRLVGTVEALVSLVPRVRFELSDGYVIYQPEWMSARTAFGLEVDWP